MFIDTNIKGLGIEEVETILKQLRPNCSYHYMKRGKRYDFRPIEQRQSEILIVESAEGRIKVFTWKGDIHLKMYPKSSSFFKWFSAVSRGNENASLENEIAECLSHYYKAEVVRVGQIR